jgi:HPt (histidine-containing phosphotransfer) domain-containing protein
MTSPSPSPPPRQQEASNPADAPRLDSAGAIANLAGDHMLYGQVVEVFLEDVSTQISDLAAAIAAADHDVARRLAHTLKGMAATVGAERLRLCALALEQACKAGDAAAIAAADPSLREEIAATNQALRDYLNHRPTNADF